MDDKNPDLSDAQKTEIRTYRIYPNPTPRAFPRIFYSSLYLTHFLDSALIIRLVSCLSWFSNP
jgi:hypothetical protein